MRHHAASFVVAIVAIVATLVCSLSFGAPGDKNIDRLLDLSGLTKQIGEFPALVKAGFMQGAEQGASLPQSELAILLESADRTILPSVILADVHETLETTLSNEEIDTLLKWYESDIGKRITVAEENASTPEAQRYITNSAQQLLANTRRVEMARRLDKLLGATEQAMDIQEHGGIAVYSAIRTAMAPDEPLDLEEYKSQLAIMEPQIREYMHQYVIVSIVYSYQSIDDESLNKYMAFLETPTARKFNDSAFTGLNSGIEQVITNWAEDIAAILKDKVDKRSHARA